jgi:hypothetical protein
MARSTRAQILMDYENASYEGRLLSPIHLMSDSIAVLVRARPVGLVARCVPMRSEVAYSTRRSFPGRPLIRHPGTLQGQEGKMRHVRLLRSLASVGSVWVEIVNVGDGYFYTHVIGARSRCARIVCLRNASV